MKERIFNTVEEMIMKMKWTWSYKSRRYLDSVLRFSPDTEPTGEAVKLRYSAYDWFIPMNY